MSSDRQQIIDYLLLITCGLSLAVLLAACGSSAEPASNDAELTERKVLSVRSSAITSNSKVPSSYTCSEDSIWLPLEWSKVPVGTKKIVLGITVNRITREEGAVSASLDTEWIVGNLDPDLRRLPAGNLPSGAFITGHNVDKPNCPPRSRESGVVFTVYAIRSGLRLKSFENIALSTFERIESVTLASGLLATVYGADSN